ncbi:LamG-like jellyroll fold domain-containing protein, partial [Lutibacter sp.]
MKSTPLNFSKTIFGILFLLFSFNAFSQTTIYSEDFNSGFGGWTIASTGSGTGIWINGSNAAHSAGASSNYVYSQLYGGNYNNNTYIVATSPTIDMTGYSNISFEFDIWYNTESGWDGMKVEYSLNNGGSWNDLGQTTDTNWYNDTDVDAFNNEEDGWSNNSGGWVTRSINLSAEDAGFDGNSQVRIRILFATDNSVTDIGVAFDNVLIEGILATPSPEINIQGGSPLIDILNGNTAISTTDDTDFGNVDIASGSVSHTFTIENLGTADLTISSISGNADFTISGITLPATITSGNATTFIITFNPTTTGTKTATISIANNDTTGGEDPYTFNVEGVGYDLSIACGTTITTFPYSEDFETGIGSWTQDAGDDIDWTNQTGGTPTNNTGPSGAANGAYYMYVEASGNGTGYPDKTANIETPCFNLTGTTNPRATFFYHMFGAAIAIDTNSTPIITDDQVDHNNSTNYMGTLNVDISTDGGVTYPTNLWTYTGYIQVDELSSWIPLSFDLSAYIGQTVKFRIQGITASDYRSDFAIDNFTVTDKPNPTFAPGGVTSNLSIWLKANDGLHADGNSVSLWKDLGVASDLKVHTTGQEPTYRDNATSNVNFNPVIEFDNPYSTYDTDLYFTNDLTTNSQFLTGDYGLYTQEMFIVLIPDDTPITNSFGFMDVYCADSNLKKNESDATGIGFGYYTARIDGEIICYAHSSFNKNDPGDGYAVAEIGTGSSYTNVGIINTRNNTADSQQELYYNATNIETTQNDVAEYMNSNDARYWLGRSEGWESSLNARVVEVISYSARKIDTDLTQERNRIQSYLAIKYGITLGVNGTSQDYVDSAGSLIWDINTGVPANDVFNYNITGIGRDDDSELNQKQSKTVNTADDITIGLTDIYTTNNLNVNTFATDKSFLVWGNDNGALAAQPDITVDMSSGIAGLTTEVTFTAISRTWKVAKKGDVSTVKISIPEAMLSTTLSPPGDYLMFISDSPTFSPTSEYRIMSLSGSDLETTYEFTGVTKYITFGYAPEYTFVRSIQFDGAQDYLDAGDVLDLNPAAFTISAWIKRENTSASIISKRDNAYSNGGYDLSINASGNLEMSWKNGTTQTITSSVAIPVSKWHHVAVIYDGTNARLYIDGVEDTTQTTALTAPIANTESFLIAAADGNEVNTTSFFNGNIDEVRIWDVALTEAQLRFVINQEIEDNTTVDGSYFAGLGITPTKNDISAITWANLRGYYPMSTYTFTNCKDASGNGNIAALKNLTTVDHQTAPLPYVSVAGVSTDWDTSTTWVNGDVQTIPGVSSIIAPTVDRDGSGGALTNDDRYTVDWNIVQISSNVTMNNTALPAGNYGNRNVLGLIVDNSFKLTAEGTTNMTSGTATGNGVTITHYLGLDGKIDLEGGSQLIQSNQSDLVTGINGELERDQQGTASSYNYNYWSSSVGVKAASPLNTNYFISQVLKDGRTSTPANITFSTNYAAADGTIIPTPMIISTYWLRTFNGTSDDYNSWSAPLDPNGTNLSAGEGFTMKGVVGTAAITDYTNFTFVGRPNNGDFTIPIALGNDRLIGNPYPSAMDANEFILDNISDGAGRNSVNVFNGALYFWHHFAKTTHNLADYVGGYATYTLLGGAEAVSNDIRINNNNAVGSRIPERYIPVNQGFFVFASLDASLTGTTATVNGGNIVFKNTQRVFELERSTGSNSGSLFFKPSSK